MAVARRISSIFGKDAYKNHSVKFVLVPSTDRPTERPPLTEEDRAVLQSMLDMPLKETSSSKLSTPRN
jgi:hypothetical protein